MMNETQLKEIMAGSASKQEWDTNCANVKRAFRGQYPTYWNRVVVESGMEEEIQKTWEQHEIQR